MRSLLAGIRLVQLACALSLSCGAVAAQPRTVLRSVAEINALERAPGMAERPVLLEGVVLYSDIEWGLLFLADRTGSIFIDARGMDRRYHPGTRIRIHGQTGPGHTKSVVVKPRAEVLGAGSPPSAAPHRLEALERGVADSALVEVRGVLRPSRLYPDRVAYRLFEGDTWASVVLPLAKFEDASRLTGSVVTLRGVSGILIGPNGERTATQIFVNSLSDIRVEEPPVAAPEPRAIGSLAGLAALPIRRPVRIQGTVTWVRNRSYFLEDSTGAVCVEQVRGAMPQVGQKAEAVGYPDNGPYGLTLGDASARLLPGQGSVPPRPLDVSAKEIAELTPRGRLVRVSGNLVEQTESAREHTLILDSGGVRFSAQLPKRRLDPGVIRLPMGAGIEVTGVATAGSGTLGAPRFVVRVFAPGDIVTLKPGDGVLRKLAPVAGAILLAAAAGLVWIVQLRRTVRRQTEGLRKAMDTAVELANLDALTGLPNRRRFAEALEALNGQPVTLLYVDLDGFKLVNDSLGHTVGDILLRGVSSRLTAALHGEGIVARLGGDEFCILVRRVLDQAEASELARRTLAAVAEPFHVEGHDIVIGASIGISWAGAGDSTPAPELLRRADNAMYSAKRQGRNRFEFFSDELGALLRERTNLEVQLRGAIGRGEISVSYQPEFDIDTNRLVRFEALLRWDHPSLGAVPPSRFIPVAEESGLIVALGAFVMQQACLEARNWHVPAGESPVQVAINVSSVQFRRDGFADEVAGVLRATGIRPDLVQLELTESVALGGMERCATVMHRLRDLGVSLAIDDFGTGYSSLCYLHTLPFDALKIDRGFVAGVDAAPEREALVGSIIALAANAGLRVIVEGVETAGELEAIRRAGGREVQGYLLGKPVKSPRELVALHRAGAAEDLGKLIEATQETWPSGARAGSFV